MIPFRFNFPVFINLLTLLFTSIDIQYLLQISTCAALYKKGVFPVEVKAH